MYLVNSNEPENMEEDADAHVEVVLNVVRLAEVTEVYQKTD